MMQVLRKSPWARGLLLAAGLLAAAASFGLHPEPGSTPRVTSDEPGWSVSVAQPSSSHACPACLSHTPAPLAGPAPVVLRQEVVLEPAIAVVARPPARFEARPRQNRAPPAVS
jgi:hypothetical protein